MTHGHRFHDWLSKVRKLGKPSKQVELQPPAELAPIKTKSASQSGSGQFGAPLRRVPTPYPFFMVDRRWPGQSSAGW
ncbi:hypothetical protein BDV28DRAFT_138366 [Aspergillus coremiiformis]|uniref:Uncharacterized protein n=1 Tax=Aspergillus coremiiformis TaxID=138285 RepID=A0A5N6YZI4_9EURO|nr:hypothetical protein BDV28DRAFT_138366 [Aspergillus coremiiformis]